MFVAIKRCVLSRVSKELILHHSSKMSSNKKATVLIQLLSTAGTGFFYTARKNPRTVQRKLAFRKYDPIVRRHVLFEEKKLPSGKKR